MQKELLFKIILLLLLLSIVCLAHVEGAPVSYRNRKVAGGNNFGNDIPATLTYVIPGAFAFSPISNQMVIKNTGGHGDNSIRKVNPQTGIISELFKLPYSGSISFNTIAFGKDSEEIAYMNNDFSEMLQFNLTSGTYKSFGQFSSLTCCLEHEGILYIGSIGKIFALNLTSGISTILSQNVGSPYQFAIYNADLYFTDGSAYKVMKMSLATNVISDVACNGNYGYSGDGSNATEASCSQVSGLAIDKDGNVYFSDNDNNKIRMVTNASGNITTLIDQLKPNQLQFDRNGVLHVSEYSNYLISKITMYSNGTASLSVVVGNGGTSFSGLNDNLSSNLVGLPSYVIPIVQTFSKQVFFATNSQLFKIGSNDIVQSLSTSSLSSIGNDPNSNDIYFISGSQIKKMSGVDGNISVIAGSIENNNVSAKITIAYGSKSLATYGGDIYYSDSNGYIRKIDSKSGLDTIIAGTEGSGYNMASGVATDIKLDYPTGISFTRGGDMLIADSNNHLIRKLSNGNITTIAGVQGQSTYNGDNILAIDATINSPKSVIQSTISNDIYIAETSRIRKILSNGTITTIAGTDTLGFDDENLAINAKVNYPNCLFLKNIDNNHEDIYFCDSYNYRLRKIDTDGVISTVAGNGGAIDNADGKKLANETSIGQPTGVDIDPLTGDIFITSDTVIYRVFSSNNTITVYAGRPNQNFAGSYVLNEFRFSSGNGLLIKDNILYLAYYRLAMISLSKDRNQIVQVLLNGNGDEGNALKARINGLFSPIKITRSGDIYFCESVRIRKVSKQTNIITTILGNGANLDDYYPVVNVLATKTSASPTSVDVDESTGIVYFTEFNSVKMIDQDGYVRLVAGKSYDATAQLVDYSGDNGPAINATLVNPSNVVVLANGDLLISDSSNNRIRKISKESGFITTIAGNGTIGSSSNSELATQIPLYNPKNLIKTKEGEIYFTISTVDTTGSIIEKIIPYCTQSNYIFESDSCVPLCYGSTNCSNHGKCVDIDTCSCESGYYGYKCELFNCSGIVYSSPNVCSRNGTCISYNNCSCETGYYGTNCELFDCFGISSKNSTFTCSGKGVCLGSNSCSCLAGYSGQKCEISPKVSLSTLPSKSFKLSHANSLFETLWIAILLSFISILYIL